jgi:hypothetical protein
MVSSSIQTILCLTLFHLSALTVSASESSSSGPKYEVRSNFYPDELTQQELEEQQQRREFVITFSDEGTPVDLPLYKMKLSPTSGTLSDSAQGLIGASFGSHLQENLKNEWDDSGIELNKVSVKVLAVTSIQNRRTLRRLQTTGSEIAMLTTLTFDGTQSPPSDDTISKGIGEVVKDLSSYISTLKGAGLDELKNVQSASFKDASNKPSDPPTQSPVTDKNSFAKANKQTQSTSNQELRILIPAGIAGVAVFMLTAFLIAQRRRVRGDLNDSSFDDSFVDESDISLHQGSRPGKDEIEVRAPTNLGMQTTNDGRTALHIPANYTPRSMMDSLDEDDEGSSFYTSDFSEGKIYK